MPRKKNREVTPTQINEKAIKEKMRKIKKIRIKAWVPAILVS